MDAEVTALIAAAVSLLMDLWLTLDLTNETSPARRMPDAE